MTRSGAPSPLKSPTATEIGKPPTATVDCGPKPPLPLFRFSSTETLLSAAAARSGAPSPLKSPTATETGLSPTVKVDCGPNVGAEQDAEAGIGLINGSASVETISDNLKCRRGSGLCDPRTLPGWPVSRVRSCRCPSACTQGCAGKYRLNDQERGQKPATTCLIRKSCRGPHIPNIQRHS